jgi:predicted alpha/beta superfamily hydrolase
MTDSITWEEHPATDGWDPAVVAGRLLIARDVRSPQLRNRRAVYVYLPPAYEAEEARRYPVVYMHDGQNLFDASVSFAGATWHAAPAFDLLAGEGRPAIAVGINHMGKRRVAEYTPFGGEHGGRGDKYIAFLARTLKPAVDGTFRTLPDPAHTTLLGSSMGGLISLYGYFARPDVFGQAGCMSSAFWVGDEAIYDYVHSQPQRPGRIYLDNGIRETSARRMAQLLEKKGYQPDATLRYVYARGARHTESAWAKRLPDVLRYLLAEPAG